MSRRISFGPIAIAILLGTGVFSTAQAADHEFCEDYARAAVNQFRDAERHERCDGFRRRDPARWQPDYRAHYEWCRSVHREQAWDERDRRKHALDECVR